MFFFSVSFEGILVFGGIKCGYFIVFFNGQYDVGQTFVTYLHMSNRVWKIVSKGKAYLNVMYL